MSRRDAIADPWGQRTPYGPGETWPVRVDSHLTGPENQVDTWARTASLLHSNGDGMDVAVRDGRIVGVRGRADDRVNRGRLDPKDLFAWQANASEDRLTTPLVRDGDRLVEADWDTAMDRIVRHSKELLDQHGPSAVGFYTSGQLFAEEYYTLAAIARGAIGTNHLDGNTRLCTATAAEALKESFGCDGQPGSYTDIDHTIALFGHNMAETQVVLWSRVLDRLTAKNPPAKLRETSGVQWPCDADHPDGTERLYAGGRFFAAPDYCESYGRDLVTGAPAEPDQYKAWNPDGKAMIRPADYLPPHEPPSGERPFWPVTGRTVYHFHTRTKTGRAPELNRAAPTVWVELSTRDAAVAGVTEGDWVDVTTARGRVRARARITDVRDGVLSLPFHYGYWDNQDGDPTAANELTPTEWDPASKQPIYKTAAASLTRVAAVTPAPAAERAPVEERVLA